MSLDRRQRARRIAESLLPSGVAQTLIASPFTIRYLTGCDIDAGERLNLIFLNGDGQMHWLIHSLYSHAAAEGVEQIVYGDGEDALGLAASLLMPGRVGIEHALPAGILLALMQRRPDVVPIDATMSIQRIRMIKDDAELALLRQSSAGNVRALERSLKNFDPRMSEMAFSRFLLDQYDQEAMYTQWSPLVGYGPGSAEPHHRPGKRIIRQGDAIVIDTGADYQGYASDMTRTVFFRQASGEQQRVYDVVLEANLAAIDAVRPGMSLDELDRIARKVIESAGYGPYFTHRLGHGIGVEGHEFPFLGSGDDIMAEKNMCFSIEPGVYLPGKFGVRIEDLVIVTDSGAEVITQMDKRLTIIS